MTSNFFHRGRLAPSLAGLAFATVGQLGFANESQEPKRFIVGLHSRSTFSQMEADLENFKEELQIQSQTERGLWGSTPSRPRVLNTDARLVQTLEHLNLAVVEAHDERDIQDLLQHPQVSYVEEEFFIPNPKPQTVPGSFSKKSAAQQNGNELTWGLKAIKAPEAWARTESLMNVTNIGRQEIKVAVLDTGIDYNHPELKNRFLAGKNFVKSTLINFTGLSNKSILSDFDLATQDPINSTEKDYFDPNGHGTHVSGTIAAELDGKGVAGVAPRARILMGRVCGKFGCSSVGIVEGINWAMNSGAQVLSMSLGGPLKSRAQEDALKNSLNAGVVNIAASGNDGTGKVSFPGGYDSVIAVGAMDPALKRADFSQWGPELDIIAPGVGVNSSVPVGSGRESKVFVTLGSTLQRVKSTGFVGAEDKAEPITGDIVHVGLGKPEDFAAKQVAGKIALIARGEIAFSEKVKNAIQARALAVLIYNNVDGLISGSLTQDGSVMPITVAMIEKTVGEQIRDELAAGKAGQQASISTTPTDYAEFNGTSMATPHVAGVAALVLAANSRLKPEEVRQILLTSTVKIAACDDAKNECGKGLVNADAAVIRALKLRSFKAGDFFNGLGKAPPQP